MNRCIAFHQDTGERCRRRVSIQPDLQRLKLCREHGRSIVLTMFADAMSRDERDALAEGTWTNVREVRR